MRNTMGKKRNTKLGKDSHEKSVRLRQETKNKIDEMLVNGTKITVKSVMEECGVSKGFVYDKDIRAYIEEAQRLQKEEMLNLPNQQQNLYWKLMASYIFQYSLMDEQEALLKDSIADIRLRKSKEEYTFNLLARYLATETDNDKVEDEIKAFMKSFLFNNDTWIDKLVALIHKISKDCYALEYLGLLKQAFRDVRSE